MVKVCPQCFQKVTSDMIAVTNDSHVTGIELCYCSNVDCPNYHIYVKPEDMDEIENDYAKMEEILYKK